MKLPGPSSWSSEHKLFGVIVGLLVVIGLRLVWLA